MLWKSLRGPFNVIERVGDLSYRLTTNIRRVHNVFHVSQLRRYVEDESHMLDQIEVLRDVLSYRKKPVGIIDR